MTSFIKSKARKQHFYLLFILRFLLLITVPFRIFALDIYSLSIRVEQRLFIDGYYTYYFLLHL